ncbi:protein containing Prepilin-type cleavage/methylation [Candidatus Magnetomorum sp. HK-1]|nr:protein containing Prepilin-type cleavage/methylation [Candidatus Magnetomorum sp. HK-1]
MNTSGKKLNKGFTLLEITATLMIIGMLSGLAGLYITNVIGAYALHQEHKEAAQKARFVINRLVNEFIHITKVHEGTENSISFESRFNNMEDTLIEFNKNTIKINHVVFADQVHDLTLRYLKSPDAFDKVSSNEEIWGNVWEKESTAIQFDISFSMQPYVRWERPYHIITIKNITAVPRFIIKSN